MAESWMPESAFLNNSNNSDFYKNMRTDIVNEEFINKLSRLILLYGLPFKYLIPSEIYLKENRIRFFHLDTNWISAMLDGALSLGRNSLFDYESDARVIDAAVKKAFKKTNSIRPLMQGKEPPEEFDENAVFQCTGFIMRSPLVRSWRGLEFKAYNASTELTALRIENLKDDILIGLYSGCITKLEIAEPPEGLHYGFDAVNKKKVLRNLSNGKLYDKPETSIELNINDNRIIDFKKCAESISSKLQCEAKSSHIALQMIQNAYKIVIECSK